MRTWEDYKNYVKSIDKEASEDIKEAEELAYIIGAIVERRNSLGISQRELAEMCGIPQSSVARIETFKTSPNIDTLLKIFRSLGIKFNIIPRSEN